MATQRGLKRSDLWDHARFYAQKETYPAFGWETSMGATHCPPMDRALALARIEIFVCRAFTFYCSFFCVFVRGDHCGRLVGWSQVSPQTGVGWNPRNHDIGDPCTIFLVKRIGIWRAYMHIWIEIVL